MSEYRGYSGESLEILKRNRVKVGDSVKVLAGITHSGIIMPRYEHSDDRHIVLKLKSGYNVGLETGRIERIEKIQTPERAADEPAKAVRTEGLPKVLLLSTGGTIASKVDYRTGAVTPVLTAAELNSSVPELARIANIDAEVLLSEYSENIVPEKLARDCKKDQQLSGFGLCGNHYRARDRYDALYVIVSLVCACGISRPRSPGWIAEVFGQGII